MSTKVALVIGAGPRIGRSTALAFSSRGYRVAIAARSFEDGKFNDEGHLQLRLDLSDPAAVQDAFVKVKKAFDTAPSVVVYNAGARTVLPPSSPLTAVNPSQAMQDMNVNVTSALIASKCAVEGFDTLPSEPASPKVFIFTGNKLNVMPLPQVLVFGMGKTAVAHMTENLHGVKEYKDKGYRFFYVDERTADGGVAGLDLDGEAGAKVCVELAEGKEGGQGWWYTFVKGEGYRKFE